MTLDDALPDRPLYDNELSKLNDDLPEDYAVIPGSAMDFGTGALLWPTFGISDDEGNVTLFGRSAEEERWFRVKSWSAEEYDGDKQAEAIEEFAAEHLPGGIDEIVDVD